MPETMRCPECQHDVARHTPFGCNYETTHFTVCGCKHVLAPQYVGKSLPPLPEPGELPQLRALLSMSKQERAELLTRLRAERAAKEAQCES